MPAKGQWVWLLGDQVPGSPRMPSPHTNGFRISMSSSLPQNTFSVALLPYYSGFSILPFFFPYSSWLEKGSLEYEKLLSTFENVLFLYQSHEFCFFCFFRRFNKQTRFWYPPFDIFSSLSSYVLLTLIFFPSAIPWPKPKSSYPTSGSEEHTASGSLWRPYPRWTVCKPTVKIMPELFN